MPTTAGINLQFLMSGRQFAKPGVVVTADRPGPTSTGDQRLAAFMESTAAAAAEAAAAAKATAAADARQLFDGINIAFLRSGRQFDAKTAEHALASAASVSRAARLEAFHTKTLVAASTARPRRRSAVGGINVEFLRSGKQFAAAQTHSPAAAMGGASRAARLEAFHTKTLVAASTARPRQRSAVGGINVEFLRSGKQFAAAQTHSPATAMGGASRAARLEAFHTKTLVAASTARPRQRSAVGGINIEFLRSGKQFAASSAVVAMAAEARSPAGPKTSKFNRLHRYYNSTLAAHAVLTPSTTVSSDTMPPTMVNLDFLKSGGEFKPAQQPPSAPRSARLLRKSPGGRFLPHYRKSKNARLEEFYKQTLEAVEAARSAKRKMLQSRTPRPNPTPAIAPAPAPAATATAERRPANASANASTPTMVNLDFLRSGLEFKRQAQAATAAAPATPGGSKSRHGRLEAFYSATLAAATAAKLELKATETSAEKKRRSTSNVATPTMVNLEFLRSGLEFVRTGTTTVWAYSHDAGAFVPTQVPNGSAAGRSAAARTKAKERRAAARSRYAKLEDFYKSTLAAQNPATRNNRMAGAA